MNISAASSNMAAKADPSHLIAINLDFKESEKKKGLESNRVQAANQNLLAELDQLAERQKKQLEENEKKQGQDGKETVNEHGDSAQISNEAKAAYHNENTTSQTDQVVQAASSE